MSQESIPFWSFSSTDLLKKYNSDTNGISSEEVEKRELIYGKNLLKPKKKTDTITLILNQFRSPLIIILIITAILASFLGAAVNSFIIILIIILSALLGFWEEKKSSNAIEKLLSLVEIKATVLRDREKKSISVEDIVPGDVILFSAGDIIPSDCIILDSKDLFVNEATLTGESFPVEKEVTILNPETPLSKRSNTLYMGTNVISGTAKALVIYIGKNSEFGKISEKLKLKPPESEFDRGTKKFGHFLMEITLILITIIFAINVYFSRPIIVSFLFALAIAVGLTPELLPAIISINLSTGARKMAQKKVIVKQLKSIENFGSMNILCTDKTGTLTEGKIGLESARDFNGIESEKVLLHGYLNAFYESGYLNPIDEAIRNYKQFDISEYHKLDEIPYDFIRKRLSILIQKSKESILITKGALLNILEICSLAETSDGKLVEISNIKIKIQHLFEEYSNNGFRVLGICYKKLGSLQNISKTDESDMIFQGFLNLFDPLKPHIIDTIEGLKKLGVSLKIITGDNQFIANNVGKQIGLTNLKITTGSFLRQISDEALIKVVNSTDLFAEVEPNQKERIILALKKSGNVVGYIGDGINDVSALHAADVGISVDTAVDVAKASAEFVMLEKDLQILLESVKEGRKTFMNTMKYIFITTSANFGNMFSMAGASLLLSFLPLLPSQILLTNLISDVPSMAIATDNVDTEQMVKPKRWSISFIFKFMIWFGLLSTVFDYIIFAILLILFNVTMEQFRTSWFIFSVITEILVLLVIRTQKSFYRSRPSNKLVIASLSVAGISMIFMYSFLGEIMGFTQLPPLLILLLIGIVLLYLIANEILKKFFFKRIQF